MLDPPGAAGEDEPFEAGPELVTFFFGDDGHLEAASERRATTSLDLVRSWRESVEREGRGAGSRAAPASARPVQTMGKPQRSTFRDEVLVTMRTDPVRAASLALAGGLFTPPIPGLVVDEASVTTVRHELTWRAQIRLGPWRHRAVRLRLYASPSWNVTALSLLPLRPRPVARRNFLRVGVRSMRALRDRIDERSRPPGPSGAPTH